jgi:Flp pilus assembly protein TadG
MKRLFAYERGQIAVLYVLAMVAMVGAVAMGTDVAVMYVNWQQLQKSVDSAALAGANYLYDVDPAAATSVATNYAVSNGVTTGELNTSVASDHSSITVSAQRTVPYYFGKVLGLSGQLEQVSATASAPSNPSCIGLCNPDGTPINTTGTYGTSTGQYGLLPVGLQYNTAYALNQPITLTQGGTGTNGSWGPGNWGALSLGAPGGNMLRSNFASGYSGPVAVNQWVNTDTGIKSGPVDQGLQDRINAGLTEYPNGTYSNHALNDPRVATLPLVNWVNINGASAVQIMGFAEVWLDSVNGGQINAHFISQVAANAFGNSTGTSYGVHGQPILIR